MTPLRTVWRLLRFVGGIFVISLLQELAHRANLLVSIALTLLGAAGTIAALAAVYSHVDRVVGWQFGETIVLLGVYLVVNGLLETFVWPNLLWFGGKVRDGQLDDLLLMPAPSMFTASFGAARPLALVGVVLGAALCAVGVSRLDVTMSLSSVAAAILLVAAGFVIAWALRVLVASVALWSPGLDLDIFYGSLWQLGRYPVDIYSPWIRGLLIYVIPVAFVSTFPTMALTRGADPRTLIGGIAAAIASVVAVTLVWQAGLRRYTSATS